MKQYKLIKEYPNSPELGAIAKKTDKQNYYFIDNSQADSPGLHPERYPEFWEDITPTYIIISFKHKYGNHYTRHTSGADRFVLTVDSKYTEAQLLKQSDTYIHSVKRLSDGEIFTVGDKIASLEWLKTNNKDKIISIVICTQELSRKFPRFSVGEIVIKTEITWQTLLRNALKVKPLLVTDDCVDIYAGDTFYYIGDAYNVCETQLLPNEEFGLKTFTFKDKKLANTWVMENKPMLSINDVMNVYDRSISFDMRQALLKLLYDKLPPQ